MKDIPTFENRGNLLSGNAQLSRLKPFPFNVNRDKLWSRRGVLCAFQWVKLGSVEKARGEIARAFLL